MNQIGTQSVNEFLADLSAKQPTPGGGAVAGLLAALSTSLGQMVLAYTDGKKKYTQHKQLHDDCVSFLRAASEEAIVLANEDAEAYEKMNALWKLEIDDPIRTESWDTALQNAIAVPMKTMELSHRILVTIQTLIGKTNALLVSDIVIAAILAEAAARSARLNVEINLKQLENTQERSSLENKTTTLLSECLALCKTIEDGC
ncbi:MAG: cyclodeaminase/cyclohydrolase family protein [Planctomycetes bacterium]|nr:cyclodeaminase/cyclohydrolase family protein [Planctomycetota bacterium]